MASENITIGVNGFVMRMVKTDCRIFLRARK